MPGRIADSDIDRVRDATDLVALAGERLTLKKAGRRYVGLCPFHDEKTPSFSINPESGLYYCFGCGESGNVFHFVMSLDSLKFPEAVEHLASRAGVVIDYVDETPAEREKRKMRPRLEEVVAETIGFYRSQLKTQGGAAARAYLNNRGFGDDAIERFEIGWAPDGWDGLVKHLKHKGFRDAEITDSGLGSVSSRGSLVDFLRARVVFPIHNSSGTPVSVAGRVLPGSDDNRKYLNGPETSLYQKSRTLYALHTAKREAVAKNQVVVCEGYTDVMALHMAGAANTVAACGTALGEDHLRLLKRFTTNVVLALDADQAGASATERVFAMAGQLNLDIRVAHVEAGSDPAEIASRGPEALEAMLAEPTPLLEFVVERQLKAHPLDSAESELRALEAAAEAIAIHPDAIVRNAAARRVARRLRDVTEDQAQQRVETLRRKNRSKAKRPSPAITSSQTPTSKGADEAPPAIDDGDAPTHNDPDDPFSMVDGSRRHRITVDDVPRTDQPALMALLQRPILFMSQVSDFGSEWFAPGPAEELGQAVLTQAKKLDPAASRHTPVEVSTLGVDDDLEAIARRLAVADPSGFSDVVPWVDQDQARSHGETALDLFVNKAAWALYRAHINRRVDSLRRELAAAEDAGDTDSVRRLDAQLVAFLSWRQSLGEQ